MIELQLGYRTYVYTERDDICSPVIRASVSQKIESKTAEIIPLVGKSFFSDLTPIKEDL